MAEPQHTPNHDDNGSHLFDFVERALGTPAEDHFAMMDDTQLRDYIVTRANQLGLRNA